MFWKKNEVKNVEVGKKIAIKTASVAAKDGSDGVINKALHAVAKGGEAAWNNGAKKGLEKGAKVAIDDFLND